jgi:hypothetical protein
VPAVASEADWPHGNPHSFPILARTRRKLAPQSSNRSARPNTMRTTILLIFLAASTLVSLSQNDAPKPAYDFSLTREDKVKLAESAAPPEVSVKATSMCWSVLATLKYAKERMDSHFAHTESRVCGNNSVLADRPTLRKKGPRARRPNAACRVRRFFRSEGWSSQTGQSSRT